MFDAVNAGANGVAGVKDLEVAHYRNTARVGSFNCDLYQSEWQTVVDLDRGGAVINEVIHGQPRLFRIADDKGIRGISGRR